MLQTLPDEILLMICGYLKTNHAGSFRLVSRHFSSIGLNHLVPNENFFLHHASLARLDAIANHPALNRNLRSVVIWADIVPDFELLSEWQAQAYGYCN